MALSYSKNKPHILKWRENNRDRYNEINKVNKRKSDNWKKIKRIFCNILLD